MNMLNLIDTTFIIPLYIESEDRLNNARTVLGYLNHHFNTNIIIHELTDSSSKLYFLKELQNLRIEHILEKNDMRTYHRTRQLNEMLDRVKSKIVVNYDIDVILPVDTYMKASSMILDGVSDIIYPYGEGRYQRRIFTTYDRKKFDDCFDLNHINENNYEIWEAKYGHCIFFDTDLYKKYGGENENFIAYGPEDTERFERFSKIGCKISRINNIIYHFEHIRTSFSNESNIHFSENNTLYNFLKNLSKQEIIEYYSQVGYRKKYNFFSEGDFYVN